MRPVLALAAVGLLAACAPSGIGAERTICGTHIAPPADGTERSPWYLDVSHGAPDAPVRVYLDTDRDGPVLSVVNLRVSDDCAHGATVTVAGPPLLSMHQEVTATDHTTVVADVEPQAVGRTRVVVLRKDSAAVEVPFVVTRASDRS